MRYANWRKGTRAVKDVALPINRAPGDTTEAPKVGLRPFDGDTQLRVFQDARAMAVAKGVTEPKPGDPLYNFCVQIYTVLYGTVDPDDHEQQFFATVDELLGAQDVGPDGILLLANEHAYWQEEVSPQIGKLEAEDYAKLVDEILGPEGHDFFERLRPSVRWTLVRTMAAQPLISQIFRSISGSTDEAEEKNTGNEPSSNSDAS